MSIETPSPTRKKSHHVEGWRFALQPICPVHGTMMTTRRTIRLRFGWFQQYRYCVQCGASAKCFYRQDESGHVVYGAVRLSNRLETTAVPIYTETSQPS